MRGKLREAQWLSTRKPSRSCSSENIPTSKPHQGRNLNKGPFGGHHLGGDLCPPNTFQGVPTHKIPSNVRCAKWQRDVLLCGPPPWQARLPMPALEEDNSPKGNEDWKGLRTMVCLFDRNEPPPFFKGFYTTRGAAYLSHKQWKRQTMLRTPLIKYKSRKPTSLQTTSSMPTFGTEGSFVATTLGSHSSRNLSNGPVL